MIKLRKTPQSVASSVSKQTVGYSSSPKVVVENNNDEFKAEAAITGTGMRNTGISTFPVEVDVDPLLRDIFIQENETVLTKSMKEIVMRLYRDIYFTDPVCGSVVDFWSVLPFGEFTLGGIPDPKIASIFLENIERMNCRTLLPHAATDILVEGSHTSSMLFNHTRKIFFDIMPHRSEDCEVEPLPFFGQDPIITVTLPDSVKTLMNHSSKRAQALRERLGDSIVDLLKKDVIELDPTTTLYVPRKTLSGTEGVSYYRRVLPIYLIEKNLFRGTLVESSRRQRGILHITLDDGETRASQADMKMISELFMNADADPLGAIIATRNGVMTEEIRCVAGDTLVHTDKGVTAIESLVSCVAIVDNTKQSVITHETKPFSVDVDFRVSNGKEFVDIDQWHYTGYKDVYEVVSESGSSIACTENHKFSVVDETGEFSLKALSDIEPTDYLILPKKTALSEGAIFDVSTAYLFGAISAYGRFDKEHNILTLSHKDDIVLQYVEMMLDKLFSCEKRRYYCNVSGLYNLSMSLAALPAYLLQLGLKTPYAKTHSPVRTISVPEAILSANRDAQLSYLAGLLDSQLGEAGFDASGEFFLRFSSLKIAPKMKIPVDLVKPSSTLPYLLNSLGYKTQLRKNDSMLYIEACGTLYKDLKCFLVSDHMSALKFKDVLTKPATDFTCTVPTELVRSILASVNYIEIEKLPRLCSSKQLSNEDFRSGYYDEELYMVKTLSPVAYSRITGLFIDCYFERVSSITYAGNKPTYDISVKGNETGNAPLYAANGFLVKNSGGDFWKWTDIADSTMAYKLRAMGVSESFASGDASIATADANMTLLIESLSAFRDNITRRVFYNKIFPAISLVHGLTVNTRGKLVRRESMLDSNVQTNLDRMNDGSRLLIPTVHWAKQLKPEGDTAHMDILNTLTEKGVPVPLRAIAAAGGFNLDSLLANADDDLELTKKISMYSKKIADIKKKYGPAAEGSEMEGLASEAERLLNLKKSKSNVLNHGTGNRMSLFARDFGEDFEIKDVTKSGKPKYVHNQKAAQRKMNVALVKALDHINKNKKTALNSVTITPKEGK